MNLTNPYLISLCSQIEQQLNFKINHISDSKKCCVILEENKIKISSHTISRLFGLIKPYRSPYKSTLNLLSQYVNYSNWEDFCISQTNIPFDPNYFLTEATDGFSLSILQLTLVNEDFDSLKIILEKSKGSTDRTTLFTAAEMIGRYVRISNKQNELLEILSKIGVGQLYFYECFVDENNLNNYFSDALIRFYLPQITDDYKKLYVYCFDISQKANKELKPSNSIPLFEELIVSLDKNKCHFHELSRWLECLILIDGFNGNLQNTWEEHLNRVLNKSKLYCHYESCWIISRSLKALLLFDLKNEILIHKEFNDYIDLLMINQKKDNHYMSLYVIQLYWIYKSKYFKNKIIYTPFRISYALFESDSNEKIAIELATASIFATGDNKKIMKKNLKSFCNKIGAIWLLKLID